MRRLLSWLAWPFTIKQRNDAEIARLVSEGKLHPGDVGLLRIAARAGRPLYMHADGRLRTVRE